VRTHVRPSPAVSLSEGYEPWLASTSDQRRSARSGGQGRLNGHLFTACLVIYSGAHQLRHLGAECVAPQRHSQISSTPAELIWAITGFRWLGWTPDDQLDHRDPNGGLGGLSGPDDQADHPAGGRRGEPATRLDVLVGVRNPSDHDVARK
jgi:hypothetical protein